MPSAVSKDSQLNVFNVEQMPAQPPGEFQFLRVDANNDCNVHCVYCHNPRTKDVIAADTLRSFFDENVVAFTFFSIVMLGVWAAMLLGPETADAHA